LGDPLLGNGWQECLPANFGTERDCNQALAAPGTPDSSISPNQLATRVVRVTTTINLTNGTAVTRPFAGNAGNVVVYQPPGAGSHALATFEYTDAVAGAISVDFQYDDNYFSTFSNISSGNLNYRLGIIYYPVLPTWALAANDNWQDSIQMAYSSGYQPGAGSNCVAGVDCLSINNAGGILNNKIAVLVTASGGVMADSGVPGYQDDLGQIFDLEQSDVHDLTMPGSGDDNIPVNGILDQDEFAVPASNAAGNDNILIIR
jgi:hypothetical protein